MKLIFNSISLQHKTHFVIYCGCIREKSLISTLSKKKKQKQRKFSGKMFYTALVFGLTSNLLIARRQPIWEMKN